MASFKPYTLSAQLSGHSHEVRTVAFKSEDTIVSTSQDKTARMWKLVSKSPPKYDSVIVAHSDYFISSLGIAPPSKEYPSGLIISSGRDAVIQVHEPQPEAKQGKGFPIALPGHDSNCGTIAVSPAGSYFVSGGWDSRAQVIGIGSWDAQTELAGHEGSVTCVLPIDEQNVLTGCTDEKIRAFSLQNPPAEGGPALRPVRIIPTGSPVRALCRLPNGHNSGAHFASASNDCVVRLWTFDGRPVGEMHGHESFVYSLAALPSGEIVSAGEDRTVRIWKDGICGQTITHPVESIWSVAVCPQNGDIVSGAADGEVRVWTRDTARVADAATMERFRESVRQSAVPKETLGELNQNLPGPEFLDQKSGTKEGQVQIIKHPDGSLKAYSWSSAQRHWDLVGSVVEGAGSSQRKKIPYKGKEWDYLLPVDVEEGKPPLQLPYNISEEPYTAARRFLEENELPISYLEEVARHIDRETKGAHFAAASTSQVASAPSSAPPAPESMYFPQRDYVFITNMNVEPIIKRIGVLNDNLVKSGDKEFSLNPTNMSTLKAFATALEPFMKSHPTTLPLNGGVPSADLERFGAMQDELEIIARMAAQWSYSDRLPGADLLRSVLVLPQAASFQHPTNGSLLEVALNAAFRVPKGAQADNKPNPNLAMMAMRAAANVFATEEGRKSAAPVFARVVPILEAIVDGSDKYAVFPGPVGGPDHKGLHLALSTAALNYAVLAASPAGKSLPRDKLMLLINVLGALLQENRDPNVLSRVLAALGTLAYVDGAMRADIKRAGAADWARLAKDRSAGNPTVVNRANELVHLLG